MDCAVSISSLAFLCLSFDLLSALRRCEREEKEKRNAIVFNFFVSLSLASIFHSHNSFIFLSFSIIIFFSDSRFVFNTKTGIQTGRCNRFVSLVCQFGLLFPNNWSNHCRQLARTIQVSRRLSFYFQFDRISMYFFLVSCFAQNHFVFVDRLRTW